MMNNIKRILVVTLLLCLAIVAVMGLSSCQQEAPHVHKYEETIEKAATCIEAGIANYTCDCGVGYKKAIDALGHTEVVDPAIESTCDTAGWTEGKHCSVCNTVTVAQTSLKPNGHSFGPEATCKDDKVCLDCGKVFVKAYHVGGEPASCTTPQLCIVCSEVVTPALGHTVVVDAAVAPTCQKTGLTEGSHCAICETVIVAQEVVDVIDHVYNSVVTDPTCTKEGYTTYTCKFNCGEEYVDDFVPKADTHEYEAVVTAPTCTAGGYTTYTCKFGCGDTYVDDEVEMIPHEYNSVVTAPTCTAGGFTTYTCKYGCGDTYVDDEVEKIPHEYNSVVTAPTCTKEGYTTYTCKYGCGDTYVDDEVEMIPHEYNNGIAFEGEDGFFKNCDYGCGTSKAVDAPVADSYDANVDNSYVSDRTNEAFINAPSNKGNWGVTFVGGAYKNDEYAGGIGGLDEAGRSITYQFVIDKDGYVDIIWSIAGSHWSAEIANNIGITDMAAHMTVTIDGKPVDVSGIALPAGDLSTAKTAWWNIQKFVIEGVALEAGVHTFKCDINIHGGVNVASMSIKSNRDVNARQVKVLTADIYEENGKVYYELTAKLHGYTVDQLEMLDGALKYELESSSEKDGITTLRYDITREYKLYPHLKVDGSWYINGSNTAGDVIGVTFEEGKTVTVNGRNYVLQTKYGMPVPLVTLTDEAAANAKAEIISADLIKENGQVYWIFTYKLTEYYPEYLRIIDKDKVFTYESYVVNDDETVTFKFNVTNAALEIHFPHLQVMEVTYKGAGHTTAGDILAPTFPTKSEVIGTKEYKIYNKYNMPVVEIVESAPTMLNTAYDLVEYEGKPCLKLTYCCIGYDETTAEFFDGSKLLPYTVVRDGVNVTYYIDVTNTVGADYFCHLRIEGQKWNGKESTTSDDGNILCPDWTGAHTSDWTTKKQINVNGQKYVLGVKWSMFVIGH